MESQKNLKSTIPDPCLSLSSPVLSTLIKSFNSEQSQLFYKVWRSLYEDLLPFRDITNMGGVLLAYWLCDAIRDKHNLTPADLTLLSLLWHTTNKGKDYTTRSYLCLVSPRHPDYLDNHLNKFNHRGYIRRARIGKNAKNAPTSGRSGKYITLSDTGIKLMNSLHSELRELIYTTHINSFKLPK